MQPTAPEVTALAINVAVPADLQWTDVRRDEEFLLTTLNVRLLPDGSLAAKAYGRPTASLGISRSIATCNCRRACRSH